MKALASSVVWNPEHRFVGCAARTKTTLSQDVADPRCAMRTKTTLAPDTSDPWRARRTLRRLDIAALLD